MKSSTAWIIAGLLVAFFCVLQVQGFDSLNCDFLALEKACNASNILPCRMLREGAESIKDFVKIVCSSNNPGFKKICDKCVTKEEVPSE